MKCQRPDAFLLPSGYQAAEDYIFASIQASAFDLDYQELANGRDLTKENTLASLTPLEMNRQVIRLKSRLQNSKLSVYCGYQEQSMGGQCSLCTWSSQEELQRVQATTRNSKDTNEG